MQVIDNNQINGLLSEGSRFSASKRANAEDFARTCRVDLSCSFSCAGKPTDAITEYSGEVYCTWLSEMVGKVVVKVVDVDSGLFPVFDILSCIDSDGLVNNALFDTNGGFSKAVLQVLDQEYAFSRNILLIDLLELLPQARGYGLSKVILELLVSRLRQSCRIALVKPFPLQHGKSRSSAKDEWASRMHYDYFTRDFNKGLSKLEHLYESAEFQRIENSCYMARDLSLEIY